MTQHKFKPYWLVLLQVTGWAALAALGITLFVVACLAWTWFPVVAVVLSVLVTVSFVVWIEQEADQ